jgi:hypothetical protein
MGRVQVRYFSKDPPTGEPMGHQGSSGSYGSCIGSSKTFHVILLFIYMFLRVSICFYAIYSFIFSLIYFLSRALYFYIRILSQLTFNLSLILFSEFLLSSLFFDFMTHTSSYGSLAFYIIHGS